MTLAPGIARTKRRRRALWLNAARIAGLIFGVLVLGFAVLSSSHPSNLPSDSELDPEGPKTENLSGTFIEFFQAEFAPDGKAAVNGLNDSGLVYVPKAWPTGGDQLLLVSLGTSSKTLVLDPKEVMGMMAVELGVRGLSSLMDDASALNELVLQWMSSSETAHEIDSEIGDLSGDILGGGKPLLTYLRYDVQFDDAWLKDKLNPEQLKSIAEMDHAENMPKLVEIGKAAADRIQDEHFGRRFDIE